MERVIDCPCCKDSDSCFEEVQEQFSSFICFKCGFMSDSRFENDSLQTIENEKSTPKLVTDLKFHDKERNILWYPSVVNMGKLGIIFPEGNPKNWRWIGVHLSLFKLTVSPYATEAAARRESFSENLFRSS